MKSQILGNSHLGNSHNCIDTMINDYSILRGKRIILVEDQALIRHSLRDYLSQYGCQIVAEATSNEQAYKAVCSTSSDFVLMDYKLEDSHSFKTVLAIKKKFPKVKIIMVMGRTSAATLNELCESDIDALCLKEGALEELLVAIKQVCSGKRYISEAVSPYLNCLDVNLTPRELQILNMLVLGLSRKEIVKNLNISPETVKTHRKNIMKKLAVDNYADLVAKTKSLMLLDF